MYMPNFNRKQSHVLGLIKTFQQVRDFHCCLLHLTTQWRIQSI